MAIDTRANVKLALGISDTGSDDKIDALLEPITSVIETYTRRAFSQASRTEYLTSQGEQSLPLHWTPVSAITSVTDRVTSTAIDSSEYALEDDVGILRRLPIGWRWSEGLRRYTVVYTGGPSTAPADIKAAFYEMIQASLVGQGGIKSEKDGDYSYTLGEGSMDGVPKAAQATLNSYRARVI